MAGRGCTAREPSARTGPSSGHARAHDEPTGFEDLGNGRVAVRIDQVVRALDGSVLSRGRFLHRIDIEDRRVTRLHIESLEAVS